MSKVEAKALRCTIGHHFTIGSFISHGSHDNDRVVDGILSCRNDCRLSHIRHVCYPASVQNAKINFGVSKSRKWGLDGPKLSLHRSNFDESSEIMMISHLGLIIRSIYNIIFRLMSSVFVPESVCRRWRSWIWNSIRMLIYIFRLSTFGDWIDFENTFCIARIRFD